MEKIITNTKHRHKQNGYFIDDIVLGRGSHSTVKMAFKQQGAGKFAAKIYSTTINNNVDSNSCLALMVSVPVSEVFKNEVRVLSWIKEIRDDDVDDSGDDGKGKEYIVSMKESFQIDNELFLIQDWCGGESLQYCLFKKQSKSTRPSYSNDQIELFSIQMIKAVSFLHRHNIIHCDLKPDHFLIYNNQQQQQQQLKLIDFGMSKITSKDEIFFDEVGSPLFSAPEVIECEGYNYKVDVWGVGVCLFCLYYNYPPFSNNASQDGSEEDDKEDDLDDEALYENIVQGNIMWNDDEDESQQGHQGRRQIIEALLKRCPEDRTELACVLTQIITKKYKFLSSI